MKLDFGGPITLTECREISLDSIEDLLRPKRAKRPASISPRKSKEADRIRQVDWKEAILDLSFPNDLLDETDKISVDTETTGLAYWGDDEAWMISMCDVWGNSWCCIWPVDPYTRRVHVVKDEAYYYLKRIVEDPKIRKSYFNAKYDMRMLAKAGIIHQGPFDESSLQARIYKTDEMAYKLKPLSRKYCGLPYDDEKELKAFVKSLRLKAKKWGFKIFSNEDTTKKSEDKSAPDYWLVMYAHILLDEESGAEARKLAEDYCRKDTARTIALDAFYSEEIDKDPALKTAYERELELFHIVMDMEEGGIRTYEDVAKREKARCIQEADELLEKIRRYAQNPSFNPGSSQQKVELLYYSELGPQLEVTAKTDSGQPKTDYKTLGEYTYLEIVRDLFRHGALEKANTLFFDKYIRNIHRHPDGYDVIHPEVNQSNTKTFRLSMSNPNLQQAANPESSARGADVIQVRNCFGPRPGYNWFLYDYSGQELRLLGGLMQIEEILNAVAEGRDIPTELGNRSWGGRNNPAAIAQVIDSLEFQHDHASTDAVAQFWQSIGFHPGEIKRREELSVFASNVFADYKWDIVKLEKAVDKKTVRTRTKMCLYGKAYGAGPGGVAALLRVPKSQAREWLNILDKDFPRMQRVANSWSAKAAREGYILNAYGRKLSVDPEFAYRATNYCIQGSAADMMKIAMIQCNKYLKRLGLDARIILSVHDELIFEIKKEHSYKWLLRGIKTIMEDHEQYVGIPMSVGISKVTESWDKEEDVDLAA